MPSSRLEDNKTVKILRAAELGGYGVLAAIIYNIEHLTAFVQAAEAQRSPIIIQLFPSTVLQLPTLVYAAAAAARTATVPISVHIDHAQDEDFITFAAANLPVDSIMIDMSHHSEEENVAKTETLCRFCHDRGIAAEAELGRIEGGEDGIMSTGDLDGLFTSPDDVRLFMGTGIDLLAPSVGNVHGDYGPKGPELDLDRLKEVSDVTGGKVRVVLHGTNDFEESLMKRCIECKVSKINVNKLLLVDWTEYVAKNAGQPITTTISQGIAILQATTERWMKAVGSSNKG